MRERVGSKQAASRVTKLRALQQEYPSFPDFLQDAMAFLGFQTTDIQLDIGRYLANGPDRLMVQAQRGEAKTTIAAIFAVWVLIHAPTYRILIVSAGGKLANEISTLLVRLILAWDKLWPLQPDRSAGDRTSVEAFDVHHTLKGPDKSPSISCCGINAQLPGKRADLLIADDVESPKNALTAGNREILLHLTREFSSIVVDRKGPDGEVIPGREVWLGTPQTGESVYNTLPGRGVAVRIWPGRYPTPEQRALYGDMLAPLVARRLDANPSLGTGGGPAMDQGQPVDPIMRSEEALCKKELDQGTPHFQLQFMLNTRLLDAERFPLKTERLVVMRLPRSLEVPVSIVPEYDNTRLLPYTRGTFSFKLSRPGSISPETVKLPSLAMYIDPAGGGANADETGWAVGGAAAGRLFGYAWGGLPGGFGRESLEELARIAAEWNVTTVVIEKNFGYGAFKEVFAPILLKALPGCSIVDDQVHGQKELRIINVLEPIIGRGSLILDVDAVDADWKSAQRYGQREGLTYYMLFQLARISRDPGALVHDDRLDALAGLANWFKSALQVDSDKALAVQQAADYRRMVSDPLGYNRYKKPRPGGPRLGVHRRK